jgi:hypothetical protein
VRIVHEGRHRFGRTKTYAGDTPQLGDDRRLLRLAIQLLR